jgi:hypothetical protein
MHTHRRIHRQTARRFHKPNFFFKLRLMRWLFCLYPSVLCTPTPIIFEAYEMWWPWCPRRPNFFVFFAVRVSQEVADYSSRNFLLYYEITLLSLCVSPTQICLFLCGTYRVKEAYVIDQFAVLSNFFFSFALQSVSYQRKVCNFFLPRTSFLINLLL